MKKILINQLVPALLALQSKGKNITLLGVGPMSLNCVQAALELSNEKDFPIMFIASRNQVDLHELGGGYVNNWNSETFRKSVEEIANKINYNNLFYLCRDHGGPWQRDKERNDHLALQKAMMIAKQSYLADIKAGFDLLMIDPTKDPFEVGKIIPLDVVIDRTVELIEFCEKERLKLGLDEIGYEVGTEETNGGLTSVNIYEKFIVELIQRLKDKNLPIPTFIVGQTGTLTRKTEQVGKFNFYNALQLATMAIKYNLGLKEHNGDYLDDVSLLMHSPALVSATNVAPQYGTEETRAYLKLVELEQKLFENNLVKKTSNLKSILLSKAIESNRWKKWLLAEQSTLTQDDIVKDEFLSLEILDIAGHYTFNNSMVKQEIEVLYANLLSNNINGQRYIVDCIKKPIQKYVECYNLEGATTYIRNILVK